MTLTRPDEEPTTAQRETNDPAGKPQRYPRRWLTIAAVALGVLLVGEGAARVAATILPPPQVFYDPVPQAKHAQLQRIAADGGVDVVVTGPSSTLFGVDPDALGRQLGSGDAPVPVYNAGITAGVPAITSNWLERYVLPRARPDTVVWVLSTVDLNDGVRVPAVDSYFSSLAVRDDVWARIDRRASRFSALVKHRSQLRSPKAITAAIRGRPSPAEAWEARLTPSGLATYQNLPFNDTARKQVLSLVADFEVGGTNQELVTRQVERMRARGTRVVLAEAPLPSRAIALHPHRSADVAAFRRALAAIAEDTGAELVVLPDELRDDALYQDYSHLNRSGAKRYTAHLGHELQ